MRKVFHILLPLALLLMVFSVGIQAQTNLITNGEFETDAAGWGGWINSPTVKVDVAVDSTYKLSGKNSYRLVTHTASNVTYYIQRCIDCPIQLGHKYEVSFLAVAADSAGDSTYINVLLEENGGDYSKRLNEMALIGTTQKAFSFKVDYCAETDPTNQLKLHYGGTYNDGDTIWVDSVSVVDIGTSMDIVIDAQRDPFYETLTGPDDGYLQLQAFHGNDNGFANGNADLSAKMWAAWDSSNFYVYEEVKDDVISMTSTNTWQNDGMELKFDPIPDDSSKVSNSIVGLQMTVYDTSGGQAGATDFPGVFARKTTTDGYVLEAAIPWEKIVYSPSTATATNDTERVCVAVDSVFGLVMQNHDNDNPAGNRDGSVQWSAVMLDAAWNHTEYLATAKFLADRKLQLIPTNQISGATNTLPYDGTVPTIIPNDGKRDPFYDLLSGPEEGFLQLKSYTYNDNGVPESDADLSAKVWTAWDDSVFYIYEEVKDDTISMSGDATWKNDCIELKFDPKINTTNNTVVGLQMNAKDTTGGVVSADFPGMCYREIVTGGYVLEAAIPWSSTKWTSASDSELVSVAVDSIFGLVIQNHDNDNPNGNRDGSVQWAAVMKDAAWNKPEYLATAKFLAGGKLQLTAVNNIVPATNTIPYDGTPFYIRVDGVKDPFFYSLTKPTDGYLQLKAYAWNDNGKPDDDADLSAKIWTAWDDECYYVYEEVKDDTISMSGAFTWNNDGMELKFDPVPDDSTQTSVVGLQMTAKDTTGGAVAADFPGTVFRKTVTGGYVLQAAIPWSSIVNGDESVDVGVGNVFGAALQNHDNDNPNGVRDGSVQWAAFLTDKVWNNAKYLGTVTFLSGNKLKYVAKNNMTGKTDHNVPYDGDPDYVRPSGLNETKPIAYKFSLKQNYPNPFNPMTTIAYSIEKATDVRLTVYDVLGREVATLVNEAKKPGMYQVHFDASRFASGIYLYRIQAGSFVKTHKMMLLK